MPTCGAKTEHTQTVPATCLQRSKLRILDTWNAGRIDWKEEGGKRKIIHNCPENPRAREADQMEEWSLETQFPAHGKRADSSDPKQLTNPMIPSWTASSRPTNNDNCNVENRKRVGVTIHQYCGSCSMIRFLDFDAAGSGCTNRRMNKQQAIPCICAKNQTNNALLHETPRPISSRLFT